MPKRYVRVNDRRVGVMPRSRRKVSETNGNQWIVTPKQMKFVEYWLTPSSETYSNAYQSAVKAGYSTFHAKQITSNVRDLEWVKEAKRRLMHFTPDHTIQLLQNHALRGKDADRLRAIEMIGKIQGLFIDRSISQVDVKFTNDVPRPVVEGTQSPSKPLSDTDPNNTTSNQEYSGSVNA